MADDPAPEKPADPPPGGQGANQLQRWGVIVGGGAIALAFGAATLTAPSDPPPEAVKTETSAPADPTSQPTPAAPPPPLPAPDPVVEPAQAADGPERQNISFVVRFEAGHPMGRAQQLAAQGRSADADLAARETIRTRRDLRGLCFDRFTNGGAEVVLRACNDVPTAQRATFQRTWEQRFDTMTGVEYADPNYTLMPESRN